MDCHDSATTASAAAAGAGTTGKGGCVCVCVCEVGGCVLVVAEGAVGAAGRNHLAVWFR